MNDEEFMAKMKEYAGKEVIIDEILYKYIGTYNAIIPYNINKKGRSYGVSAYDMLHDMWYMRYIKPEVVRDIRLSENDEDE